MAMTSRPHGRRLFVAWQNPESRSVSPVGCLIEVGPPESRIYYFSYLKRAQDVANFEPFVAFPDFGSVYRSETLFPFFQNRVMSRRRADYPEYVRSLRLPADAEPFDILARSGGRRSTDPIEVFPEPDVDVETAHATVFFFVRGIRHLDGAEEAARSVFAGIRLYLAHDLQNPFNPRAYLLVTGRRRCAGWVPDYLVEYTHDMINVCGSEQVSVQVDHVNDFALPASRWLLCKMTTCSPDQYVSFSGGDFELAASIETG